MIYCSHCGSEVDEGSRYCSQCGQQIEGNQQRPIHKSEDPEKKKWLPVLIPTSVFLLVSAALFFVYTHEQRVNHNVIQSKQKAEDLALSGHFKEAEEKLLNAVNQRPDEEALTSDLRSVQAALDVRKEMDQIEVMIEKKQLQQAEEQLDGLQQTIQDNESQLFLTFVPETNSLDSRITVMKINQELSQMTNIDELASRLNELSGLNLKEAAQVREKVTEKMVSLSTEKAEKALSEKQYTEAISSIDHALQYVVNNQKLLQLKERIQQEKTAFEDEQKKRLEQAMQQAAEDELKNQTDALEVVNAEVRKDEFGDYMVTGNVKSVATQIISTVTATYEVLNRQGEVVKSDKAKVYPIYLNPQDEGSFEKVYYDLKGEDYSVRVTELEWLVE